MASSIRQYERLNRLARRIHWLGPFMKFIDNIRIDSKEISSDDERGSKLEFWTTQRMFLEQLCEGLERGQHTFLILKGRQQGLCYDPSMRVLKADLTWRAIEEIAVGDELVACDETPPGRNKGRRMQTCVVQGVREIREWAFELEMDDGTSLIATADHRHLCKHRSGTQTEWRRVRRMRVGDMIRKVTEPWSDEHSFEDGWMGGMIDGEGSLGGANKKGRTDLAVHQVAGPVLERVRKYLLTNGYNFREEIDRREPGDSSKLGSQNVHKLRVGRTAELFRLMGKTRPTRFVDRRWWEGKELPGKSIGDVYGRVVAIRSLGERRMIDLQTTTKTFVCEGYVSHNSTITLAVLLFWIAVHPRTIAALVCNEERVRDAFRDLLSRYHASFPPEFFGDAFAKVRHNSSHFLFSNGSRIDYLIAGTRKSNWGESRGYSACLCTEVAAYGQEDGIRNFIEALAQENPDRLFLFESTAKGPNHWQAMWQDAEHDEETTCRIFLGWWAKDLNRIRKSDPRYAKYAGPPDGEETDLCNEVLVRYGHVVTMEQLAWWRWKLATSDRQSAEQNQPWTPEQAFVLSGYSFFATRLLQEAYEKVYHKPFKAYRFEMGSNFWQMRIEQIDPGSTREVELKIWEDPVREAQYVIGCDPAFGHSDDSDNHAISCWRCYADRLVQVAEYADNRFESKHCAWALAGLAGAYRNSIVNLELYGPGRVVMNEFDSIRIQLRQEMYNPMREENDWDEDFMAGARWFMYRRQDSPGPGFVFNFETNQRRKFELFNMFRDAFTSNLLELNSAKCIEEMNTMVQEKGDIAPQAPGRQHDDRPFAAALAVFAWESVVCGALRASLIAAGATYERVSAAERGENVGGQAIVDKLVYSYFQRAEEAAMEREDAGPWANETDPDPFLLSSAGWKARRGLV